MFFKMFFIKVKKHVFMFFYMQVNVFIIYGFNISRRMYDIFH